MRTSEQVINESRIGFRARIGFYLELEVTRQLRDKIGHEVWLHIYFSLVESRCEL